MISTLRGQEGLKDKAKKDWGVTVDPGTFTRAQIASRKTGPSGASFTLNRSDKTDGNYLLSFTHVQVDCGKAYYVNSIATC